MFDKNALLIRLSLAGIVHEKMATKFAEFSKLVKSELTAGDFPLKGIQYESSPISNTFSISFAGKKILFSFSISISIDDFAMGRVSCFMERHPSEVKLEEIGTFSFTIDGEKTEDDSKKYRTPYFDHPVTADVSRKH